MDPFTGMKFLARVRDESDPEGIETIASELVGSDDRYRQKEKITELIRMARQWLVDRHVRPTEESTLTPDQRWTRNQLESADGEGSSFAFVISTVGSMNTPEGEKVGLLFPLGSNYIQQFSRGR